MKNYSTIDLVKDTDQIEYSVSHYEYKVWSKFYPYKGQYQIITVDKLLYTFDIMDGTIISVEEVSWLDFKLMSLTNGETLSFLFYIAHPWTSRASVQQPISASTLRDGTTPTGERCGHTDSP